LLLFFFPNEYKVSLWRASKFGKFWEMGGSGGGGSVAVAMLVKKIALAGYDV